MRNYILNDGYFRKIDSERKAYFLGFIYADGCNCQYKDYKTKNHNLRYRFTIALKDSDIDILKELNKDLTDSSKPILFRQPQKTSYKDRIIYSSRQCKIDICDKTLCFDLHFQGVNFGKRKTGKMKIPVINKELLRHFIRGYMDGDGCIILRKDKIKKTLQSRIIITGSVGFLLEIQKSIIKNLNINVSVVNKTDNIWGQLVINGNLQVIEFLDWIYKDSNIFLKRKHDIYQNIPRNCQQSKLAFQIGGLDLTASEVSRLFGVSAGLLSHLKNIKKMQPGEILLYLSSKYKKIGDENKEVDKRVVFI